LEADKKVLVSKDFMNTTHGGMSCVQCHGGSAGNTRAEAHREMAASPSAGSDSNCITCHSKIADSFKDSLHATTAAVSDPQKAVVVVRANPDKMAELAKGLQNNCGTCHIQTCGECHVSRPKTTGGGFVDGHKFYKTPKSTLNCTACHGSRIEKEYMGKASEDYPELQADVHWLPTGMQCAECHTSEWIHVENPAASSRYETKAAPSCEKCHTGQEGFTGIAAHRKHAVSETGATLLQCQVCHSQSYNNCYSCHVGVDKKNLPYFKTENSGFDFKIGRNPDKSPERPYDYVVVRHVPVAPDTFSFYGDDILSNFDAAPTWKYATPHNILRVTPQAGECNGCHGNKDIFLTGENVLPEEKKANEDVLVTKIPPKI